jgi:UDP-glucose 4-epimerase
VKSILKKLLVTGAKGFVGSNTARHFKSLGFQTYGIGHGNIKSHELSNYGLDQWINSDIRVDAIKEFSTEFDLIIHCAGSGSVGFSIKDPYQDYKKTVDGTLEVLEYIRLYNPKVHLIYPSSPAVQGVCKDEPINEEYIGKPESPYGYHKKIAEDFCRSYSNKYNIKIFIIRLFSVYGNGLKKQLLWDACKKFIDAGEEKVEFWGTGKETRDFIHIDDVLKLIQDLIAIEDKFLVINGGTGVKITINEVVFLIRDALGSSKKIIFNQEKNEGNPIYYWASTKKLHTINKLPKINFREGLVGYVKWIKTI